MDFSKLSESVQDSTFKDIYTIVAKNDSGLTSDAIGISLGVSQVQEIRELQIERVRANLVGDGAQTLEEMKQSVAQKVTMIMGQVNDGFYNPVTKIGTQFDPGYYNDAFVPVSMTPNEVTSYYSSGGIPAAIIDKKAKGLLINGYTFEGLDWTDEEIEQVKNTADALNLDTYIKEAMRDGLSYGGDLMVPHLRGDSAIDYEKSIEELGEEGKLEIGCIDRFWTADRWNCVLVPDYNVSASSYLNPGHMFVPITGLTVNTKRAALLRPRRLPYWGTIRQMGWGISDMESWIRSVLAYELCIEAIPIMSQQMSLLFRIIPLDGVIAQNGPQAAEEFAKRSSAALAAASNINIRTVNAIGEIKAIERNFTGYEPLVKLLRQDIGAKSRFPESVLFHSQAGGFSDNEEDTTLKQAEVIQEIAKEVIPQFQPIVDMLVYSTFGYGSPQALKCRKLRISFDSPTVLTNEEKNQAGQIFGGLVTSLTGAGVSVPDAIALAKPFIPDIELPQDVIDAMTMPPETETNGANGADWLMDKVRGEGDGVDWISEAIGLNKGADYLAEKAGIKEPEPKPLPEIVRVGKSNGIRRLMDWIGGKSKVNDSEFREEDHPRKDNGQFGEGGGSEKTKESDKYEEKDTFGNGNRIEYTNKDSPYVFVKHSNTEGDFFTIEKKLKLKDGSYANVSMTMGDKKYSSLGEAESATGSAEKKEENEEKKRKEAAKYSKIPNLWKGDAQKVAKTLIDEGVSIDKFVSSQRSESKYIYLTNGEKIRISSHELPMGYESADYEYRPGDNIKDLIKKVSGQEK